MDLEELNNLLRPHRIVLECNKCEAIAHNLLRIQSLNSNTELTAKKIKKASKFRSNITNFTNNSAKKMNRRCRTEKKEQQKENWAPNIFSPINTTYKTQEQLRRQSNFFMELKLSNDKFLNCPQFENLQNNDNVKTQSFGYEATATTLNMDSNKTKLSFDDIGELRKNLFDDDKCNRKDDFENYTSHKLIENVCSLDEIGEQFELDFAQIPTGFEFFNFP